MSTDTLIELAAEAAWKRDYPNGGSLYPTYESTNFQDKEVYRKEVAPIIAALQLTGSTVAGVAIDAPVGLDTNIPTTTPLLPCPFCGNAAEITFWDNDEGTNGYYPNCSYCTCEIEGLYTKEESITAWNKRAPVTSSEISVNVDILANTIWQKIQPGAPGISRADIAQQIRKSLPVREISQVNDGWRQIDTAPKDQTIVLLCTESGYVFPAQYIPNMALDKDGKECGAWLSVFEGFRPPCWTDDQCWQSNEDEKASDQPLYWRPPITKIEGGQS